MNKEIERKFLLKKDFDVKKIDIIEIKEIKQGYLHDKLNLRIRIINNKKATLTYKEGDGLERDEFEVETPLHLAKNMMKESLKTINKTRHIYKAEDGKIWELDYFKEKKLWLAEIELNNTKESFKKPDFILKEVTDDPKYSNKNMTS